MYTSIKKLVIHEKLIQKMWCIEKKYVFLVTYCKIFHPKSPFMINFYDKSENDHKNNYSPWVLHHHWLIWLWSHPCRIWLKIIGYLD
jgi:hypothetical protein